MSEIQTKLKPGWAPVKIEDCLFPYENGKKIRQGWSPLCEKFPAKTDSDWGVLKTSAIQDGFFVETENKHLPEKLEPREHLEVVAGDLLLTCAGPRSRCGVACLVRSTRPKLLISGKMYQLRCDSEIAVSELLEFYLREYTTQKLIDEMKTGISDSGLNLTHKRFSTLTVPLPPLNEQKRIVAKIEELFSELDAGVASLKQARTQLGTYRQSLLKQAFEGKLTAQWRREHPDQLESPEQLLTRIQQERETRYQQSLQTWQTAIEEWEAAGKEGKKPAKPRSLSEIVRTKQENTGTFPTEWTWMHLGDIADVSGGLTKNAKREVLPHKIPYLRVANVYSNELRLDQIKKIGVTEFEAKKVQLEKGDLLIVEGNGSIDQIGRVAAWNGSIAKCGHQNHLIRARCYPSAYFTFVLHYLLSPVGRSKIEKQAASTSGLHTLSVTKVQGLTSPLCSLPEQQEIVRLLEEQFTAIEQNEREIDASLRRAEALRQSILKRAFSGQLVPQDPTDEPAAQLLARIQKERSEREAQTPKKKATKKKIAKAKKS